MNTKEYKLPNGSIMSFQHNSLGIGRFNISTLDMIMNSIPVWIPVSTKLPDDDIKVLCQTMTKNGKENLVLGYYSSEQERWICGMNSNVVAWMPLPEPYRGE